MLQYFLCILLLFFVSILPLAAAPQQPLSCAQFEQLFPSAIKYPTEAYFTLKLDDAKMVCFYDKQERILLAFILSQASYAASPMASILRMKYDPQQTRKNLRSKCAIIYHEKALREIRQTEQPTLPCPTLSFLSCLLFAKSIDHCTFQGWDEEGISFQFLQHKEPCKLFLSPYRNNVYNLLLWEKNDYDFGYQFDYHSFLKDVLHVQELKNHNNFDDNAKHEKNVRKIARMTGLRNIVDYDIESKLCVGNQNYKHNELLNPRYQESKNKKHINKWSMGIASSKYKLSSLPPPAPKPFPEENASWPSRAALAKLNTPPQTPPNPEAEQQPPPQQPVPLADSPPAEQRISIPLTPMQALQKYLEQLQNMHK